MINNIRKDKLEEYSKGNRIISIKQAQSKRFIKKENRSIYEVDRKMPTMIKELSHLYGTLDMCDLQYLRDKHNKNNSKYELVAIKYALSNKSEDSEVAKKIIEQRYYGESINYNCLDGEAIIYDNDI